MESETEEKGKTITPPPAPPLFLLSLVPLPYRVGDQELAGGVCQEVAACWQGCVSGVL